MANDACIRHAADGRGSARPVGSELAAVHLALRADSEKLERCGTDTDFWIQAAAGLAVFGSADELKVFKLQQPVPELLSVADRFQIKPLIRSLQRDGRYQLLALTLTEARLYEGTRDTLEPVGLEGAPIRAPCAGRSKGRASGRCGRA
jgi:hypothetical protein